MRQIRKVMKHRAKVKSFTGFGPGAACSFLSSFMFIYFQGAVKVDQAVAAARSEPCPK